LLVPGTASVWRLTVHPDDLKRLTSGIAKVLRDGVQRSKKLLSLHDVLDHFGVHGARDRWHAGAMLTALSKGGVLKAPKVTRPARGDLRWFTSQRYDRDQVARLLDRHGCGLAQLAASWANGELDISKERSILPEPDPAVEEAPRAKGKRGPKFNPQTQAINEMCYDLYYTQDKSRGEVTRLVNQRFGPCTIMNDKDVKDRADRWATRDKQNPLPMPSKLHKARGGAIGGA
jgi:hypothetical protein